MKLVSYNIQYGFGSDGATIFRAQRGSSWPTIAVQEVGRNWQGSNVDDQPELVSRLRPDYHWVYGPAFDMDASERRDGRLVNRRRQFGTMVLSKLPIVWSRLHALPMRRTLRPLNTRNAALECMIRTPAGPVRVLSLHLAHIAAEERLEQIDYLLAQHRRAPSEGGPWSGTDYEPARNWTSGETEPENPLAAIWMGDFNMEPGSAEYRRIVGSTPYHRAAYLDGCRRAAVASSRSRISTPMEEAIDGG